MAKSLILISMLSSLSTIDPLSVLFPSEIESPDSAVSTHVEYMNLDDDSLAFEGYHNEFAFIAEEYNKQLLVGFGDRFQQYGYDLGQEHYDVSTKTSLPFLALSKSRNSLWLSPEAFSLNLGALVHDVELGVSISHESLPLNVSIDSYEFDINESLDFYFTQEHCNAFFGWRDWKLQSNCSWGDSAVVFNGGIVSYQNQLFLIELEYQEKVLNDADDWDDQEDLNGKTEINIATEYWGINAEYKDWQIYYQYRIVSGDLVTELLLQDDLIAGIGKGRYFITGLADFHQQILRINPPKWKNKWGAFSFPVSFSYFDDINAKANLYEPLLFLGLPILTDTEQFNVTSALIGSVEVQWQKQWNHWQLYSQVGQLIPLNVEGLESNDSEDGDDKGETSSKEKTEHFWPGFSIHIGLSWRF